MKQTSHKNNYNILLKHWNNFANSMYGFKTQLTFQWELFKTKANIFFYGFLQVLKLKTLSLKSNKTIYCKYLKWFFLKTF